MNARKPCNNMKGIDKMRIRKIKNEIPKSVVITQVLFCLSILMYIIQLNSVQGMAMLVTEFVSSVICCILGMLAIKVCISNKYFKNSIFDAVVLIYFLVRMFYGISIII